LELIAEKKILVVQGKKYLYNEKKDSCDARRAKGVEKKQ
jgi:hypothetical protein